MEQVEQITFYEYLLNFQKCKVTQYKCIGVKVQENRYRTKFFENDIDTKRNFKIIDVTNFEKINTFRIFSFNNDFEYYKQLLLAEYKETVEKNRAKLERQEQLLKKLKS